MKKLFSFLAAILVAGSMWAATYTKITSTADIVAGRHYLFVYEANATAGKVMNMTATTTSTKRLLADDATIANHKITSTSVIEWTLGGNSTDGWFFYNDTKYFANTSSGSLNCTGTSSSHNVYTIAFSDGYADVCIKNTDNRHIRWNGGSNNWFAQYATSTGDAICLYMNDADAGSGDGDGDDDGDDTPEPVEVDNVYKTATFNGKNGTYTTGWATTGTGKTRTDCIVIGTGENITSPALDLSKFTSVTVKFSARRFGTLSGSKATVDLSIGGSSKGTLDITNGSVDAVSGDITFTPTSGMTAAQLVFTCTNATSAGSTHGAGIGSIMILAKIGTVSVTNAEYATYYNADYAYVMPEGLEGITVEDVNSNSLTLETRYVAGYVVPADEALILHGEQGNYDIYARITSDPVIAENMLKGTSTADEMTTGNVGDVFYRLSQHDGEVGFYYGAADGAAFAPGANKAYLAVPASAGAPERFVFDQNPVATGVENVATVKATKALVNGQLVIVRNGAKFNLNGMLVK